MAMKKRSVAGCMVALLMLLAGCGADVEQSPMPGPARDESVVFASGEAVPAVWANISAQSGGVVLRVAVEPGDDVAEGAVLVQLDSTDARLAVAQAQAALEAAQAQVALLEAGVRPEEIAVAEAQLEAAEASLAQAIAQRDQLTSGAVEAEIAAARAQVAAAEAQVLAAREAHNRTLECYDLPGGGKTCPLLGPVEEQARAALRAAEEALAAAQAQLNALLASADARTQNAEAAVWGASAQRDIAQAQLARLRAGASEEEIAVARAAAAQAQAALDAARATLDRCRVRAPFAGTVGAVYVRAGEVVVPGQPLIALGDLTTLRVETTDLDETDVARVAVGQQARVTFDAIPETVFSGRVARIDPMSRPGIEGSYTVVIELDNLAPSIRWGMTAFVSIEVE